MFKLISCFAIAALLFAPASAQNASGDQEGAFWKRSKITLNRIGPNTAGMPPVKGEFIYTRVPDVKGNVIFTCMGGKFFAGTTTKPEDSKTLFSGAWWKARTRMARPTLTINGEKTKAEPWANARNTGLAYPGKTYVSRKLYNSAIRGDSVTLQLDGAGMFDLILPKPNNAFADFGAQCGLGRNK